jgi:hypothetical protein
MPTQHSRGLKGGRWKLWGLAGASSIVIGILLFVLTIHFIVVVYDEYHNVQNKDEWTIHHNRMMLGTCGNTTHEILTRETADCDLTRDILARTLWGYFPWGYWKLVLKATLKEHCGHIESFLKQAVWTILSWVVVQSIASPTTALFALVSWMSGLLMTFSSFFLFCDKARRARNDLEHFERQEQTLSVQGGQRMPEVSFDTTRPIPPLSKGTDLFDMTNRLLLLPKTEATGPSFVS